MGTDFTLAYVVQAGPAKGLGITWRNASLRSQASSDVDQNRVFLTYSLALFRQRPEWPRPRRPARRASYPSFSNALPASAVNVVLALPDLGQPAWRHP